MGQGLHGVDGVIGFDFQGNHLAGKSFQNIFAYPPAKAESMIEGRLLNIVVQESATGLEIRIVGQELMMSKAQPPGRSVILQVR